MIMITNYTPGPWEWTDEDEPWLVSVNPELYGDKMVLGGNIEWSSEANAKLIAAAPDMAAELMRLMNLIGTEDYSLTQQVLKKAGVIK